MPLLPLSLVPALPPRRMVLTVAVAALLPWSSGRRFSNFTEEPVPATSVFEPGTLARLRAVRSELDPTGMFLANHGLD